MPNVEGTGGARLYRTSSGGPQGYAVGALVFQHSALSLSAQIQDFRWNPWLCFSEKWFVQFYRYIIFLSFCDIKRGISRSIFQQRVRSRIQ